MAVHGAGITLGQHDSANTFLMASQATKKAEGRTGRLAHPDKYVRGQAMVRCWHFPVLIGWEGTVNERVAVFVVDDDLPDSGRTFAMFIGSISNYRGFAAEPVRLGGFHPSDIRGFYRIVDSTLEPSDVPVDARLLAEESELDDNGRCETAFDLWGSHVDERTRYPMKLLDIFAQVHVHRWDFTFHRRDHYDTVILGAPIWLANPVEQRSWYRLTHRS
jgi:hypothetical protein